jgi:hypothetical protein
VTELTSKCRSLGPGVSGQAETQSGGAPYQHLCADAKPHDVIMEGIDLVLAKYGFPSVADLKKGKP